MLLHTLAGPVCSLWHTSHWGVGRAWAWALSSPVCFSSQTWKSEGFFALYKGFWPNWLRLGPWNIIVSFLPCAAGDEGEPSWAGLTPQWVLWGPKWALLMVPVEPLSWDLAWPGLPEIPG